MPVMAERTNIRLLSRQQIRDLVEEMGQPRFRAGQLYQWIWQRGAAHFEEMTNLPKSLRTQLAQRFVIPRIRLDKLTRSVDGTFKLRFRLHDDHLIESVLIPVAKDNRYTLCVSTQVGCSLHCTFCATGKMGLRRQLTVGEIVDQYVLVNRLCQEHYGHPVTNIVYMGMGEPLLNYKNTIESIARIASPDGYHFSPRRITISTAGIAKQIRRLADDSPRVNLALSLHAADDFKRNEIMAINASNNLDALMAALEYFAGKSKGHITFEYIMLKDFNDTLEDATRLAALCRRFPVKVNLIEYNPTGDGLFEKSAESRVNAFAAALAAKRITVTVRRSRGRDIDAACGQLANKR